MKIHDITLTISESMVLWPGDPSVHLSQPFHLDRGDIATVTQLKMGVHTGTHVDAPLHFIPDGAPVESLDLHTLIGPALVVEEMDAPLLTADVLDQSGIPPGTERVLFRTKNSHHWVKKETAFFTDFVAISQDGARWLVDHHVRLVGVDYLSAAPFDDLVSTHEILLRAGMVIVEGLNLHHISPGRYELVCLPLKITGSEGAPARVVLLEQERER